MAAAAGNSSTTSANTQQAAKANSNSNKVLRSVQMHADKDIVTLLLGETCLDDHRQERYCAELDEISHIITQLEADKLTK